MKSFFKEFKKFISRGNVLDLAVGVIIGSAFTAIVTALTDGILKPLINWLISGLTAGNDINSIYTFLKTSYVLDASGVATSEIDLSSSIYIDWGAFISAIINFLLVAFVLFLLLKGINSAREFKEKTVTMDSIIAIKQTKGVKLSKTEKKYLENKAEIDKAKKEEEERLAKEAAKLTKTEELLTEIRDALKDK